MSDVEGFPGWSEQEAARVDSLAAGDGAWEPPVPRDVLEFQMRIAIREATDLKFVPESLRHYASEAVAP